MAEDTSGTNAALTLAEVRDKELELLRPGVVPKPNGQPATDPELVGLALSGGGIRSATFSLGVLQAIARKEKLGAIDYLSTVSGGGYIGGFLTAWIHRKGLAAVQKALKPPTPSEDGACEAPEVTWLRRYSNYLAPKLGLLSADSMTLVATWTRNVFLNLLIVVSLLGLAFMLPRVILPAITEAAFHHSAEFGFAAGWLGFFLFPIAVSFNLSRLSSPDAPGRVIWVTTTPGVLCTVVLPAVLATVFGSISIFSPASDFPRHLAGAGVVIAALLAAAGFFWFVYQVLMKEKASTILKEAGIFFIAYAVALVVGAGLALVFIDAIGPVGHQPIGSSASLADFGTAAQVTERTANIMTFGPPALLISFGIAGTVFVGLVGRVYFERTREWWGRMNAWLVAIGSVWLVFFVLTFYVAPIIDWVHAISGEWLKTLASAGWVGSLLAALLVPKPGTPKTTSSKIAAHALDWAATIVAVGFFVAIAYGVSVALEHVAGGPAPLHVQSQALKDLRIKIADNPKTKESTVTMIESRDLPLAAYVRSGFDVEQRVDAHPVPIDKGCDFVPESLRHSCKEWATQAREYLNLPLVGAVLCATVFLLFGWRVDVNKFSLHNMYKNRLIRCYLGASRQEERIGQPFTGFDERDDLDLSALRKSMADRAPAMRPLHILNTALNLTHGTNLAWQERKAASFTFTPWWCGFSLGPGTGDTPPPYRDMSQSQQQASTVQAYRDTTEYASENDEGRRQFSLGMAIATSGAAVSPNMGRASTPALAFVLTLFNVRLGRWSPNPSRGKWRSSSPSYGLICLIQELFGFSSEARNFVYLSDGGHFDNTGIYELVRRRCMTILAVDAGADLGRAFDDLANVVRKCRVDAGVNIHIDLARFGTSRRQESASKGYAVGSVDYGNGVMGRLIVIKPTLLALRRLSVDVFSYARKEDLFPQQSTSDQFFDESQFESYRALGESIATTCLEDPACHLP